MYISTRDSHIIHTDMSVCAFLRVSMCTGFDAQTSRHLYVKKGRTMHPRSIYEDVLLYKNLCVFLCVPCPLREYVGILNSVFYSFLVGSDCAYIYLTKTC